MGDRASEIALRLAQLRRRAAQLRRRVNDLSDRSVGPAGTTTAHSVVRASLAADTAAELAAESADRVVEALEHAAAAHDEAAEVLQTRADTLHDGRAGSDPGGREEELRRRAAQHRADAAADRERAQQTKDRTSPGQHPLTAS